MAAQTFEWKIKGIRKVDTEGMEGVIIGTQWICKGIDENGYSGSFAGATPFKLAEMDENNFIPYSELTEETVLNWIKNSVSGSGPKNYWDHISERINKEIRDTVSPVVKLEGVDLPWASSDTHEEITPRAHME